MSHYILNKPKTNPPAPSVWRDTKDSLGSAWASLQNYVSCSSYEGNPRKKMERFLLY